MRKAGPRNGCASRVVGPSLLSGQLKLVRLVAVPRPRVRTHRSLVTLLVDGPGLNGPRRGQEQHPLSALGAKLMRRDRGVMGRLAKAHSLPVRTILSEAVPSLLDLSSGAPAVLSLSSRLPLGSLPINEKH